MAMWFAVLKKRFPFVYTVNGSRSTREDDFGDRVYWFKVNPGARTMRVLTDGVVYVLPKDRFDPCPDSRYEPARYPGELSQQWISPRDIEPLYAMRVSPTEFPFVSSVVKV